jgi:hypothetical protein
MGFDPEETKSCCYAGRILELTYRNSVVAQAMKSL